MHSLLSILAPVFALVLLGWGVRKAGWLPSDTARHLNLFVFVIALPALLFRMIASTPWGDIANPAFIAAILVPAFVVMALASALSRFFSGHIPASVIGFTASNPNSAIIGLPLCLLALGDAAAAPAAVTNVLTGCILMPIAVVFMSFDRGSGAVLSTLRKLAVNPLFLACIAGVVASVSGLPLGGVPDDVLAMLGRSASPTALVALGLFLGDLRLSENVRLPATLTGLKLVLQPLLAAGLCLLLPLPDVWRATAILMSAAPTATGTLPIVHAMGKPADISGQTILVSTMVSLITLSLVLMLL